jgi:hypothetical protein
LIKAKESVRVAVRRFAEAAEEAASFNGVRLSDVKWIVPHQANLRILQQMAKRLDIPFEKVYVTIEKYGNISSATIPIALDEAVRNRSIQRGDLIILTAFGGGLTWASSLLVVMPSWYKPCMSPIKKKLKKNGFHYKGSLGLIIIRLKEAYGKEFLMFLSSVSC